MKTTIAKTLTPAFAALVLALPAHAGGMAAPITEPTVAPAPMPVYAAPSTDWTGGYVGAQLGYGDITSGGAGLDGNGAIGGIYGGYRMDFGKFVSGVEVGYDASNVDLGSSGDKLDNVARLKLIGGVDLGQTLVYGTIGAARAKATVSGSGLSGNGYLFGVGADYALNDKWTVGGELLSHHFDNFGSSGVDLKATTVEAKVAYRF